MSIKRMSFVWDLDLPGTDKLVLLALADWADDAGRCWPSITKLRTKCGLSERGVQIVLRRLEGVGHLDRDEVTGRGVNYTVLPRTTCTPASDTPPHETAETPARRAPNTLRTTIPKKDKPSLDVRARKNRFPIPDGVTAEQFSAFRQQRKKPLNERAYTLLVNKLQDLAEHGYPPGQMIDLAIERGWETVFEPKENRNGRTNGMGRNHGAGPSTSGMGRTVDAAQRFLSRGG